MRAAALLSALLALASVTAQPDAPDVLQGRSLNPGVVRVTTGPQLLEALAEGVGSIALAASNITITPLDWQQYELPIRISEDSTVRLYAASPQGGISVVNWGGAIGLIYVSSGAAIEFEGILSIGIGDYLQGMMQLPTYVDRPQAWPTITGTDNFTVSCTNCYIYFYYPSCSNSFMQSEVETANQHSGGFQVATYEGGTALRYANLSGESPVLSTATQQQVGTAMFVAYNSTVDCNATGTVASQDSGGGTPAWVWAVVGSVGGVALLAGGLMLLMWRKQQRQRRVAESSAAAAAGEWSSEEEGKVKAGLSSAASLRESFKQPQPQLPGTCHHSGGGSCGAGAAPACPSCGNSSGHPSSGSRSRFTPAPSLEPPSAPGAASWLSPFNSLEPPFDSLGHSGEVVPVRSSAGCLNPMDSLDAPWKPVGADMSPVRYSGSRRSNDQLQGPFMQSRIGGLEGLELGELLGRGAYGRVYKGLWNGAVVAVKVIEHQIEAGSQQDLSREPLLSLTVSHPHVVITHRMCFFQCNNSSLPPESGGGSGEGGLAAQQQAAAEQGWFGNGTSMVSTTTTTSQAGNQVTSSGPGTAGGSGAANNVTSSNADAPVGSDYASAAGGSRDNSNGANSAAVAAAWAKPLGSGSGGHVLGPMRPGFGARMVSPGDMMQPGLYETWLITEFCDRGSLASLVASGALDRIASPKQRAVWVLRCVMDVARGLEYLHSIKMVHGDLKPANVLLKTIRVDSRGFVCKLCDFGLSRMLGQEQTHVDTQSYGTANYAAPELLSEGHLNSKSDIYSLGLIMWELQQGRRLYTGLSQVQVIAQVLSQGLRPPLIAGCPADLASMMQRCWHIDPAQRPDASAVVHELSDMLQNLE